MDSIFKWLADNKDALVIVLGSGIFLAVVGILMAIHYLDSDSYKVSKCWRDTFPFEVIKPNSNVAKIVLRGEDGDPLADRNIPYQTRTEGKSVRRELEHALEEKRWLLLTGRTGLGKTREAIHLLQSLMTKAGLSCS